MFKCRCGVGGLDEIRAKARLKLNKLLRLPLGLVNTALGLAPGRDVDLNKASISA